MTSWQQLTVAVLTCCCLYFGGCFKPWRCYQVAPLNIKCDEQSLAFIATASSLKSTAMWCFERSHSNCFISNPVFPCTCKVTKTCTTIQILTDITEQYSIQTQNKQKPVKWSFSWWFMSSPQTSSLVTSDVGQRVKLITTSVDINHLRDPKGLKYCVLLNRRKYDLLPDALLGSGMWEQSLNKKRWWGGYQWRTQISGTSVAVSSLPVCFSYCLSRS